MQQVINNKNQNDECLSMVPEMCHFSGFHLWCSTIYGESQYVSYIKFHNGWDLGLEMDYYTLLRVDLNLSSLTYHNEYSCLF